MGKTKIEWSDRVWNVMTGCLGPHNDGILCPYCYAYDLAVRFNNGDFIPKWHPERLDEPLHVKKPSKFFVGSVTDMLGNWVTQEHFIQVMRVCENCPQHTFYFLTKQPQNYHTRLPSLYNMTLDNVWWGATVTCAADAETTKTHMLQVDSSWNRFVSIEPMLGPIDYWQLRWADWIIIGGLTGPGAKERKPNKQNVQEIITNARFLHVPVFLKENLHWPTRIQEWPQ